VNNLLALAALGHAPTVIGIDGHGGGPHVLWGIPVARTVGDLWSVRDELDAAHIAHIVHVHTDALRLVSGPPTAAARAAWSMEVSAHLYSPSLSAPAMWWGCRPSIKLRVGALRAAAFKFLRRPDTQLRRSGDFTNDNGTGGRSIYGAKFAGACARGE
jgi:hypothetical protein